MGWFRKLVLVISFVYALFVFPRYTTDDDEFVLQKFDQLRVDSGTLKIPVMSFNVRFDGLEKNPDNHFKQRVHRIVSIVNRTRPLIAALQEPFPGQLVHLHNDLSTVASDYHFIGNNENEPKDLGQPMLYDNNVLELLEHESIYLSETPGTKSRSWGSKGFRGLNAAVFRFRKGHGERPVIVAINTHLDVWSELARRKQASMVLDWAAKFRTKFPSAVVLVFGDFNTAPGQQAHDILTSPHTTASTSVHLSDTWDVCANQQSPPCFHNTFSSTFHGWLGTGINKFGSRLLHYVGFTLYAMGLSFPHNIPTSVVELQAAVVQLFSTPSQFSVWEALPSSLSRLHIDWILYQNSNAAGAQIHPIFMAVIDVRDNQYSSDHFPLLSLFEVKVKFN